MRNSSGYKKGQWFIISAVVLSGIFLSISGLLKTYSKIDTEQAAIDTDFYFWNIREGLKKTVESPECSTEKIEEFENIIKESLEKQGVFVYINHTGRFNCATKESSFGILLATEKAVFYENILPNDSVNMTKLGIE